MKAAVLFLPNPFDHTKRELYPLKRASSVRYVVRKHLRHKTSLRTIDGRRRREFDLPTVCYFNGRPLKRATWRQTIVRPGDVVTFHTLPAGGGGGGGGGGGSSPVAAILAISIAVAVPILGPALGAALGFAAGTIGASLVTAGVGLALGAVAYGITSLFVQPPPAASPAISGGYGDTGQVSPTYSSNATGNIARLGQPIPAGFGRNLHVPDFVSAPYVRYVDNDQYVFMLLGLGQGRYSIEQLQIGDTPVASFTDITWEQIEPNAYPTTTIADPRIITSADISDIELQDAAAGSPYVGPFIVNPAGTTVDRCEIDGAAPRGLYDASSGSVGSLSVNITIEAQQIDDSAAPIGSWSTLATVTKSGPSTSPLRWTDEYVFASEGRWQVRMKRTDTMNTSTAAGHQYDWIGLKGRLTANRRFAGMTCIGVKAKITSQLNAQTLQVKALATRMLPTWDPTLNGGAGGMNDTLTATRDPCDAYAEIARNTLYGGRIPDAKIDLAGIYANQADFAALGWTFDYVYDQSMPTYEALSRVARAVIAQTVVQGGKIRLVRDVPNDAPVMMFSPHNTKAASVNIEWLMVDDTTADSLIGVFMNQNTWKQDDITVAFDDSAQENPSTIQLYGVSNRAQAWAILWNMARGNRYRRRTVTWDTEMEGLILQFGDRVSFSTDIVAWGQSGELVDWDPDTRIATLSNAPEFTIGPTYYIGLRDQKGLLAGTYIATAVAGQPNQVVVGDGALPDIFTGGDRERTYYQFGIGEAYARRLITRSVTPRTDSNATLVAFDDDPRMFAPLPDITADTLGVSTADLTIHISAAASKVNLRDVANNGGFSGLSSQQVTIIQDIGAPITSDDPTVPAILRGTWPTGYKPIVVLKDVVTGADGAAGTGGAINGGAGSAGGAGGTALDASSGPLSLDDSAATLRGGKGGGGGGGGGGATAYAYDDGDGGHVAFLNGGKGGDGNGGHGLGGDGFTPASAGSGGDGGAQGAGYGVAGGNGATGGTGTTPDGSGLSGGGAGGAGGAGGKAINGIANITRVGTTGTETGAVV